MNFYALKTSKDPEYTKSCLQNKHVNLISLLKIRLYDGDEDPAELFIKEFVTGREV